MPRRQNSNSFERAEKMGDSALPVIALLPLLISLGTVILAGCSDIQKNTTPAVPNDQSPVLEVKQLLYSFSMYPEYENETRSLLKLGIRNNGSSFVHAARAFAYLKAKDGHETKVNFSEDLRLEKYMAEVALENHEDYVIDTHIEMPDSSKSVFTPRFSFHCCNPIPEPINPETTGTGQGSEAK